MNEDNFGYIEGFQDYSDSMKKYYKYKIELMNDVLQSNLVLSRNSYSEPFCQCCKKNFSDSNEMHLHHPDNDGEAKRVNGESPGGYQNLYRYKRQFYKENKNLWVLCSECHYLVHKRDGDEASALKLMNSRPWLEYLKNVDPEFHIVQRFKDNKVSL